MTVVASSGQLVALQSPSPLQPFPRSSVPLGSYGSRDGNGGVELVDGYRIVSYTHILRTQLIVAILVNKLTRQISRLPLKTYTKGPKGRTRVTDGPLPDLLNKPWNRGGPVDLKQAMTLPVLVHGNGGLRKVRRTGRGPKTPIGFDPLVWRLMRVEYQDGGPILAWGTIQPGQPETIVPDDMFHIAWRGLDGPLGISPLQQLGTTIAIEDAAQRYQKSMMRNNARPPSALQVDKDFIGMEPKDRQVLMENLRTDAMTIYSGPERGGMPAVLPPGVTWAMVGHNAQEAELIQQRKLTREEAAACYDVPPPLIGLLEKATFNNISELHRMLYITVLGPWLTLIEESFKAQVIDDEPEFEGMWVEFDLAEVLKGDLLTRSQALALQISHGILTIDEARDIENRPRFGTEITSGPLYPSNNLTPATTAPVEPTGRAAPGSAVAQAAEAVAGMSNLDLQRLMAQTDGSIVTAILELAGVPTNGHRELATQA